LNYFINYQAFLSRIGSNIKFVNFPIRGEFLLSSSSFISFPHFSHNHFHLPNHFLILLDCSVAEDKEILGLVTALTHRLSQGEVFYIHCWGGRGRTGTLVALLLSHLFNLEASEALQLTQLYYSSRIVGPTKLSPESLPQYEQVRRLAPLLRLPSSSSSSSSSSEEVPSVLS
jgi:hypothetical protein